MCVIGINRIISIDVLQIKCAECLVPNRK